MQKPIALIVLNWNKGELTSNCIDSIIKNCNTAIFDIIVADNGSTDGSLQFLRTRFPDLIYLNNNKNLGFAGGNNRAFEYSISNHYKYSLILNNDTIADENFVERLYEHIESNKKVAAVQPAIFSFHNKSKLWNGGSFFNRVFGFTYVLKKQMNIIFEPDWLTGCCCLFKNSALEEVGLFDERFFLYYEDSDLSFRLKKAGFILHFLPHTKIFHAAGASGKNEMKGKEGFVSPVIHYYNARNRIWFLRKHGDLFFLPFIFAYQSVYFSSLLVYFLIRGRVKKATLVLKAIKYGLFTNLK